MSARQFGPIGVGNRGKRGAANANWKGGRTVTSHGYVLIRVGKDHPMADVRGYCYEHRLVAAQKLGRWLKPGEEAHHDNERKDDNAEGNIIPEPSHWHHRAAHRRAGKRLRNPGEENPIVYCQCDCGGSFLRFDATGRPRSYISGHNPLPGSTASVILDALAAGPMRYVALAMATKKSPRSIANALVRLKRRGRVERVRRGEWRRVG